MLIAIVVFVLGTGLVVGGYFAVSAIPGELAKRRLDRRLQDVAMPMGEDKSDATILKSSAEGPLPALDRLMAKSRAGVSLARLIEQAGSRTTPSAVVVMSIASGTGAALLTSMFVRVPFAPLVAGVAAALIPYGWLRHRRSSRLHQFEEQFPEALDLLSRAVRAGHAFQTAMGMVGDDLAAPVGPEFKKTFDEQNFGLPLRDALNQLTERIPILDVRFFVTAVLIQRETGGNLAEILDNLAHVVRERFKIQRQVRVHTAHGRFTAWVLLALPAALAVALSFLNPDHMQTLFREHMGQMMLLAAIVMQTVGYLWIRQVIKIEV
ncbi:MAG TPA: type II secretion system F family protein [Vicinamibacterales bacterium]|jgi:tight adherence protein B|nr:type II secretion system F family protein [Vicinamibacterales bacterium]